MTTSLLDLATPYLTPAVLDRLASFTGESPAATTKAFTGAAPAVLAGMLGAAQDPTGLNQLVNLFQQGKFDGSMLDNLPAAFSGSSMDGLMKMGGPLLGSIFGARSSALTELIAGYAGVKKSSAMSLLSAAAPLVMSVMGRQMMSRGGISAGALKDLLAAQRGAVAAAAPPGLGQLLGMSELGGGSPAGLASHAASASAGGARRLLPLLLGVVALLALFAILRSCGGSPAVTTPPADTMQTLQPAPGPVKDAGSPSTTRP